MNKIGIFYGSTTGTTAHVAMEIAHKLNIEEMDVHDVSKTEPSVVDDYDLLIMGTSTWGDGDMQEDWYDFLAGLEPLDLSSKCFAVFGCGDETMKETFCSGVGKLYQKVLETGAKPGGEFNEFGYNFSHSGADIDGKVVGLVLDEVNHPELTSGKINEWTNEILKSLK